jgi:hypothetical protein
LCIRDWRGGAAQLGEQTGEEEENRQDVTESMRSLGRARATPTRGEIFRSLRPGGRFAHLLPPLCTTGGVADLILTSERIVLRNALDKMPARRS